MKPYAVWELDPAFHDIQGVAYDPATGQALPLKHRDGVNAVGFSRDGRRVVTASNDQTARVWDAATGSPRTAPLQHEGAVEEASFSPDGRKVVTASADHTARVWDAETGAPLTQPLPHGAGVAYASFSPDGRRVVTASLDKTARVWDATTGQPVSPPLQHRGGVHHAPHTALDADGRADRRADAHRMDLVSDRAGGVAGVGVDPGRTPGFEHERAEVLSPKPVPTANSSQGVADPAPDGY